MLIQLTIFLSIMDLHVKLLIIYLFLIKTYSFTTFIMNSPLEYNANGAIFTVVIL